MSAPDQIQLSTGIVIELRILQQAYTYDGLLEGVPTTEMNRARFEADIERARQLAKDTPLLIPPRETPIELSRPYPFGTPARIPAVRCIARWREMFETRGERDGWAELTTLWYQDKFALPISVEVLSQLQAIDWARHSIFEEA